MRISELARAAGVTPPTIRYYEAIGVLPAPPRAANGYRHYGPGDLERLRFVTRARALDFSLDEIREVLAFRERGEAPCRYVLEQIRAKIAEIDRRMAALAQLKQELEQIQAETAHLLPESPAVEEGCVCHLIQAAPVSAGE